MPLSLMGHIQSAVSIQMIHISQTTHFNVLSESGNVLKTSCNFSTATQAINEKVEVTTQDSWLLLRDKAYYPLKMSPSC